MQTLLDSMNTLYKTLTEKEAEAVGDLDGSIPGLNCTQPARTLNPKA